MRPPDLITDNADSIFVSKDFCLYASTMAIVTNCVLVEALWSIGIVERYYAVLQKAYKFIINNLQRCILSKKIIFQMNGKIINNIAGPNGLVLTLL